MKRRSRATEFNTGAGRHRAHRVGYNGEDFDEVRMAGAMADDAKRNGLAGLRVLCLESRRGQEMSKLIANYGGEAIIAPSMQEVTLKDNPEALAFARKLAEGGFEMVILLTGGGTRALARLGGARDLGRKVLDALGRGEGVGGGPKPM